MEYITSNKTTNHYVVVFSIEEQDTRWEYLWNHSKTIELWCCLTPLKQESAYVRVFPSREIVAVIPARSPDGELATLGQARSIAQTHASINLEIQSRVVGSAQRNISTEQY